MLSTFREVPEIFHDDVSPFTSLSVFTRRFDVPIFCMPIHGHSFLKHGPFARTELHLTSDILNSGETGSLGERRDQWLGYLSSKTPTKCHSAWLAVFIMAIAKFSPIVLKKASMQVVAAVQAGVAAVQAGQEVKQITATHFMIGVMRELLCQCADIFRLQLSNVADK